MGITRLKEPHPRVRPLRTHVHSFPLVAAFPLPPVREKRLPALDLVLASRHSHRDFKKPLPLDRLGDLLWYAARVREQRGADGCPWESRVAPSAGGCHPIHVAVLRASGAEKLALIYDGSSHALGVVDDGGVDLRQCLREIAKCLPFGKGTILWFLADTMRTGAKYRNPESLMWRDSGALLAIFCLVAEALGLEACGVGIHETPALRKLFKLSVSVVGMGGCIVAAPSS